jgi:hypothetical protein
MSDATNRDEDIMGFQNEIRAVIRRAKTERDLRVAEVIGVLQMEIMEFWYWATLKNKIYAL